MNFYNAMHGVDPATFSILPMLGYHPDWYPRFRDCKVVDSIDKDNNSGISVLTRLGGDNREFHKEDIEKLRAHPNYIEDKDMQDDNTYARFLFSIPKEFDKDYDLVIDGNVKGVSPEYKKRLYEVYPKLKDKFDSIFNS